MTNTPINLDYFEYRSEKVTESGCWLWTEVLEGNGYGTVYSPKHKRRFGAHRIIYALVYGPFPKHLFVCHRCDVPCCINPSHLFLGTAKDNMIDKAQKGRGKKKLTANQVLQIRKLLKEGKRPSWVSRRFGCSHSAVNAVASGKTWKWLAD